MPSWGSEGNIHAKGVGRPYWRIRISSGHSQEKPRRGACG